MYEGDDLGLHVMMRMVTSSCYVHDVDGSHVCLEVLIVSMMMGMLIVMMMMGMLIEEGHVR